MWMSLGLSATLLVNIPFFGDVDLKKMFKKAVQRPAPADTLPPVWKHASRLALENQFVTTELPEIVPGPSGLRLTADPRRLRVAVDPDSGTMAVASEFGEVTLGEGMRQPLSSYSGQLSERNFRRLWSLQSRTSINSLGPNTLDSPVAPKGLSLRFGTVPGRLQKFLGPGGPAINVYGSENIRISGTSNWTNQQVGQLGQKRSLFPTLDMQQDLDIRLEGQLSDRIRVNMLQNSANQIPLANRIAVNYKGDEDALFQQVDLGNTNLSLPGTQYVSYSGKNEGLFGIKAASRLGPLDVTVLASKQEGRSERASYGGGASKQTQTIRDLEYVKGVYFFLANPHLGGFDVPEASIRVYRDDGIASNDVNVVRGIALPDPLRLTDAFADDSVARLGKPPVAARGYWDLLNAGADRDYEILSDVYGTGFRILRLTQALQGVQRLAVTYQRRPVDASGQGQGSFVDIGGSTVLDVDGDSSLVMQLVRVPPDLIGTGDATGIDARFDSTMALFPVREMELRNFYQLAGQRIDAATFKLQIRRGRDEPPKTTVTRASGSISYIEVFGLDNFDETSGTPIRGQHDGKVDGSLLTSTFRAFVDFENGTLFFPELRPFAPRLGLGIPARPFDVAVAATLDRREFIRANTASDTTDVTPNTSIYDKYLVQNDTDPQYFIEVEFSAGRAVGEISLGRGNLLDGSEVVTINGQSLQRGRDYDIDYDLGRVTLKRQLGPADQLAVDYSYAPLFQQAGRTLIGSSFRLEGRDRSLGGAFLYESRGAQDLRPRLGEEPARSLIGDLNAEWGMRPDWMTRFVDLLPGIRTTAGSDFRIQAEVGASFPNPNTRNEVYIDDMEGVRDAVSLTLDPYRWRWSSVPRRPDQVVNGRAVISRTMLEVEDQGGRYKNAEVHWYSPYAVVKENHLKPTLTQERGGENNRQVLALSVPRRPLTSNSNPGTLDTLWTGLTYSLDQVGLDISRSQFIELWVNDFNDHHDPATLVPRIRGRHVRMHIDVGRVPEDQMRAPDLRPDNLLNTEDRTEDAQLDVTDGRSEDTGLDGRLSTEAQNFPGPNETTVLVPPENNAAILDLVTSHSADPEGDDWANVNGDFKEELDARRFQRINGTEGDKNVFPYPGSEDMNGDGSLGREDNYFEYTIDLGDAQHPYLVTDVQALKLAGEPGYGGVSDDNGWRRYRIPLDDSSRVQFGTPDLSIARHVRVWLEGITLPDTIVNVLTEKNGRQDVERPLVMLGSLEIVGSRWRKLDIDTTEVNAGATLTLNSVNTLDNAEIYKPPFDPGSSRSGSQSVERREQAMALEFTRLRAGRTIEAFKTFSIDENYSRYGKLNWFVTGFGLRDSLGIATNQGLYYFVRLASDETGLNYYEFRAPVPHDANPQIVPWSEVRLALTELSALKLSTPGDSINGIYRVTIGGVERIVGPRTAGSPDSLIVHGRPSFTRLRRVSFGLLNDRGMGFYDRGQLWFDELRAIDVAKDEGRAQRISVTGRMANLLNYNFSWNGRDADFLSVGEARGSGTSTNAFAFSGSFDLHRFFEATGIVIPVAFNFSQNSSQPRFSAGDDIVRGGADLERSESFSDSRSWSTSYSRTWSERAHPLLRYTLGGVSANYQTQNSHGRNPASVDQQNSRAGGVNYGIAPRSLLSLPMPGIKGAKLFPLPERVFLNYRFEERTSTLADRSPNSDFLVPRDPSSGRSGSIAMGADSRPFDLIHHHIEAARNLQLKYRPSLLGGSLNVGQNVTWSQSADASYTAKFLPFVKPQLSWNSRYNQNNGPELSPDLSVRAIQNGQQGSIRMDIPLATLARAGAADSSKSAMTMLRSVLGRLGNVQGDFTVGRTSTYSRVVGTPDFLYMFGLSDDPGLDNPSDPNDRFRMTAASGNQAVASLDWRTSARATITLPWNVQVQTVGDYQSRTTTSNGAERGQDQFQFPNLRFDFGDMPARIKLDKIIRSPRLTSAFSQSQTTDYNNGRSTKSSISRSIQFRPLLELSGELRNGMRIQMSTEHRHSERELFQLGSSLQQDNNTDVDLSLNRSYSQGQRLTFFGKETTVRSSVSIGITGRYERQTGRILQGGIDRNPVNRDRLSLNANGTYGFSSNVNGNATLGFSQDRDNLRDIVHRSVRIELSTRFTF